MSFVKTNELEWVLTSHQVGLKKIIENNGNDDVVPQIAKGFLKRDEEISSHKPKSMVKHYYFLD